MSRQVSILPEQPIRISYRDAVRNLQGDGVQDSPNIYQDPSTGNWYATIGSGRDVQIPPPSQANVGQNQLTPNAGGNVLDNPFTNFGQGYAGNQPESLGTLPPSPDYSPSSYYAGNQFDGAQAEGQPFGNWNYQPNVNSSGPFIDNVPANAFAGSQAVGSALYNPATNENMQPSLADIYSSGQLSGLSLEQLGQLFGGASIGSGYDPISQNIGGNDISQFGIIPSLGELPPSPNYQSSPGEITDNPFNDPFGGSQADGSPYSQSSGEITDDPSAANPFYGAQAGGSVAYNPFAGAQADGSIGSSVSSSGNPSAQGTIQGGYGPQSSWHDYANALMASNTGVYAPGGNVLGALGGGGAYQPGSAASFAGYGGRGPMGSGAGGYSAGAFGTLLGAALSSAGIPIGGGGGFTALHTSDYS